MFLSCLHCCHPTKHRFSAKEGATRPDQARPRTNIQVFSSFTSSYCWVESDTQLRACYVVKAALNLLPFCLISHPLSDSGWEVWRGWKRGSRQVQRQGRCETKPSEAPDEYAGTRRILNLLLSVENSLFYVTAPRQSRRRKWNPRQAKLIAWEFSKWEEIGTGLVQKREHRGGNKRGHERTSRWPLTPGKHFFQHLMPSGAGWQVWGWQESGAWQVQRQGGGQTKSSEASDKHSGDKKNIDKHAVKHSDIHISLSFFFKF